jgi:hypothetical protein
MSVWRLREVGWWGSTDLSDFRPRFFSLGALQNPDGRILVPLHADFMSQIYPAKKRDLFPFSTPVHSILVTPILFLSSPQNWLPSGIKLSSKRLINFTIYVACISSHTAFSSMLRKGQVALSSRENEGLHELKHNHLDTEHDSYFANIRYAVLDKLLADGQRSGQLVGLWSGSSNFSSMWIEMLHSADSDVVLGTCRLILGRVPVGRLR